jgi:hypothetical protein
MARFRLEGELTTNSSGKMLSFPESEKKKQVPRKRSLDEKFRAAGQKEQSRFKQLPVVSYGSISAK